MNLGDSIREVRKKRLLTQRELAEKLGVTNTYLSAVENGSRKPSRKLLSKICESLDVEESVLQFLAIDESTIDQKKLANFRQMAPVIKKLIFDSYL
jgi:transcriptional regulator with XRE-family HTH domain